MRVLVVSGTDDVWTFDMTAGTEFVSEATGIADQHIVMHRDIAAEVFTPMWRAFVSGELMKTPGKWDAHVDLNRS